MLALVSIYLLNQFAFTYLMILFGGIFSFLVFKSPESTVFDLLHFTSNNYSNISEIEEKQIEQIINHQKTTGDFGFTIAEKKYTLIIRKLRNSVKNLGFFSVLYFIALLFVLTRDINNFTPCVEEKKNTPASPKEDRANVKGIPYMPLKKDD